MLKLQLPPRRTSSAWPKSSSRAYRQPLLQPHKHFTEVVYVRTSIYFLRPLAHVQAYYSIKVEERRTPGAVLWVDSGWNEATSHCLWLPYRLIGQSWKR